MAGKTTSLAAPRVVDALGPVVATSTKTDLLRLTAGARAERGPVLVWDPDRLTGWEDLARWDIVAGCEDVREASGPARAMVAARPLGQARNTGFFAATAETVLRYLLHAAALSGGSMCEVMAWARDFAIDAPYAVLRDHPRATPEWFDDLRKYCKPGAPETISSTDMSLGLVLNCLSDPRVLDLVCPGAGHGIEVDDLVAPQDAKPATLYVLCEGGTGATTAPLATALVSAIVRAGRRGSQHRRSPRFGLHTFVLDRAPNVAPVPEMPMLIADGHTRHQIPPCWAEHPTAVEELTALMVSWKAAYGGPDRPPSDALIAWHDRWLWPCLTRLNEGLQIWNGCRAGRHKDVRPVARESGTEDSLYESTC